MGFKLGSAFPHEPEAEETLFLGIPFCWKIVTFERGDLWLEVAGGYFSPSDTESDQFELDETEFGSIRISANYKFFLTEKVTPYVGLGLGWFFPDLDVSSRQKNARRDHSVLEFSQMGYNASIFSISYRVDVDQDNEMGLHFQTGFDYKLSPQSLSEPRSSLPAAGSGL